MKIISKSEAIKLNLKRYFTGKMCRNGHTSERHVHNGRCDLCLKFQSVRKNEKPERKSWNKNHWAKMDRGHRMILKSRGHAKERNIPFTISAEDLALPKYCPVLGLKLEYYSNNANLPNVASIDRIDCSKGYIKGNVQVISRRANELKRNGTLEEFKLLISFLET